MKCAENVDVWQKKVDFSIMPVMLQSLHLYTTHLLSMSYKTSSKEKHQLIWKYAAKPSYTNLISWCYHYTNKQHENVVMHDVKHPTAQPLKESH